MLMQKISDKEFLLSLIDVYEALEGFKLSMNGYYDMKEDAAIPFYLTLTDEQTNTVNEGKWEAWEIYLSDAFYAQSARYVFLKDMVLDDGQEQGHDHLPIYWQAPSSISPIYAGSCIIRKSLITDRQTEAFLQFLISFLVVSNTRRLLL